MDAGPTPRAGRAGWAVVVSYAAVAACTQLLWLTFAPITTGTAEHYGVSQTAVGWLANAFPLLYVVLAIPAGLLLSVPAATAANLIWLAGNLGGLVVALVVGALVGHPRPAFLLLAAAGLGALPLLPRGVYLGERRARSEPV